MQLADWSSCQTPSPLQGTPVSKLHYIWEAFLCRNLACMEKWSVQEAHMEQGGWASSTNATVADTKQVNAPPPLLFCGLSL